jgi:hypothetical protein
VQARGGGLVVLVVRVVTGGRGCLLELVSLAGLFRLLKFGVVVLVVVVLVVVVLVVVVVVVLVVVEVDEVLLVVADELVVDELLLVVVDELLDDDEVDDAVVVVTVPVVDVVLDELVVVLLVVVELDVVVVGGGGIWQFASQVVPFGGSQSSPVSTMPLPQSPREKCVEWSVLMLRPTNWPMPLKLRPNVMRACGP